MTDASSSSFPSEPSDSARDDSTEKALSISQSSSDVCLQISQQSCAPTRWAGRSYFQQAVRWAVQTAREQQWRSMFWCDPDFADWPLGERQVAQDLRDWALGGGQLTLLLHSDRALRQRHARFVAWRGDFDHRITSRRVTLRDVQSVPSVLWCPQWALQRLDVDRCHGMQGSDPAWLRLQLDALQLLQTQRSVPGFAATTLGL